MGSVFEFVNKNAIFGVLPPSSPLYTPILALFALTGLPSAGWLFYKAVTTANEEAERQDKVRLFFVLSFPSLFSVSFSLFLCFLSSHGTLFLSIRNHKCRSTASSETSFLLRLLIKKSVCRRLRCLLSDQSIFFFAFLMLKNTHNR